MTPCTHSSLLLIESGSAVAVMLNVPLPQSRSGDSEAEGCLMSADLTAADSQTILSLFAVLSSESLPSRCLLSFLPFHF